VRRASILAAASKLFAARDFDAISVADIATKAGLAKGTVYLYFGTKEALFLMLVAEQLENWLNDSIAGLKRVGADPARVAAAVASTLSRRPNLIRLLGLLHAVLERNAEVASLRDFKRRLLAITTRAGAVFAEVHGLPADVGIRVTLWMHAIIVGLSQMTATSPTLSALLVEDDSLTMFRLDFRTELQGALTTLLAGAIAPSAKRGRGRPATPKGV